MNLWLIYDEGETNCDLPKRITISRILLVKNSDSSEGREMSIGRKENNLKRFVILREREKEKKQSRYIWIIIFDYRKEVLFI